MKDRINILGSNIDALTMDQTLKRIRDIIKSKRFVQHVVVNASKINLMNKDEKLRDIVNKCELINADGQSVVWASRILKKPLPERVTGIDIFQELVKIAAEEGFKIYLFGARQEVIEKVAHIFKMKYPELQIVGFRNGYFRPEDSPKIAQDIFDSGADILFVALPSPRKEYWINEYMPIMKVPFAMGVGGSFDVVAGLTTRAPLWMQKRGLEWLYRFIQEPRKMWKRYLFGNIEFIRLLLNNINK